MKKERKVVKEIKTPFKELTLGQKIGYIFGYYKYYFIAGILIIVTVAAFINSFRRNNYTTDFKMMIVNGRMSGHDDDTDAITTGFTQYLGINGKSHRVVCDYNLSLKEDNSLDQDTYISQSKIVTMSSAGDIDGYLADYDHIGYFSTDKEIFLYDLRELLTEEELEKISDHVLYYTKADGTTIPYAVDLTDTKIKTETNFTIERPCYGVVITSRNYENGAKFIRYAFNL